MAIVGAAIAGIKGILAAGGIGAFLIRTAASLGLSLLAQALAPKPKQPGVRIDGTSSGEEIPQSFVIGRYATSGHLEYHNSHGTGGTPNEFYQLVISLSDVPGVGLRRLRVNDKFTNRGEDLHPRYGAPMLRFRRGGTDNGWVRFYDGTQTVADADLVAAYENDPDQPWTADHKLTGVAYAIITLRYDREVWQGVPRFLFVMDGIPLYDPRKDTTAGGSGAHRWDNPATWEPTENLAVQAYNLKRGIPLADGSIYGGQVDAEDLPFANWVAGMNICDTTIGSRAQFRGGLEIRVTEEPAMYVEELLKAGLGQISEVGGVFRTRWGAPDLPVFSFTDGDISISDPQQFDPFPGLENTHNAIRCSHPSAGNMWEPVQTPLVVNAEWEASDGNRRLPTELALAACFNHAQAQQVARAYIEDARRFRTHQIVLPGDAQVLEALDTVEWSSARNGYQDKLFEVVQVQYLPGTLFVALTIRERDPEDYDWSSEFELPPPPELDPTPIDERVIPAAEWTVTAAVVEDETGTARRPAISINWAPGVVTDARALRYQVRVADTNVLATQGRVTPSDGTALVSEGVLPATGYIARLRPVLDRPSDWTDWKPVTTPDVRITHEDVTPDLREEFEIARELLDGNIETIIGVIGDLRDRIGDYLAPIVGPLPPVPHIPRLDMDVERIDLDVERIDLDIYRLDMDVERIDLDVERIDLDIEQLVEDVARRADDILLAAGNIRNERDRIRRVAQEVMEAAAHGEGERQEIRREISVELGDVRASFNETITLLASQEAALAQQVTQLVAEANDLAAEILRVDTARVDGENALASQISLLSVGSAVQFDHVSIWYWDETVEGWTGSPAAPTVSGDGWLVPAGYVVSPAGLEVDSAAYRQVRARLRNEPGAWADAYLYWAAEGQGWDNARRVAIDNPDWADDEAALTINPPWPGVIDRIRVDLPGGVEIDWLAVGRPAPGASSADIAAERMARISADEALASDILTLTAELTDAEGLITANADALSALTTRVTETEDGITSLAQAQTAIQSEITDLETGQQALSQAVDNLETLTESFEDALRTQSTATRAVRSSAALRNSDILEALAQALGRDTEIRDVVATATQELRTSIEFTDEELRIIAQAVTQLQAAIPGLATADALQLLITRVVATEGGLEVVSAAQTLLTARIEGVEGEVGDIEANLENNYYTQAQTDGEISTAVAAAELALNTRIGEAESDIGAVEANLANNYYTAVQTDGEISTAVAAAELALNSRIGDVESEIGAVEANLANNYWTQTQTDGEISTAVAAAELALNTRIGEAESDIGAVEANLTNNYYTSAETDGEISTAISEAETVLDARIGDVEEDVGGLAEAVDSLTTFAEASEDATRVQSQATRAVRSSAALRSNDMLEALAQALGRDGEVREVVATATQDLRTLIEFTDEELRIVAQAVTQLQAAIPGLATADALQLLITRVVATEDGVESLAASLLTLTATVGDNAAAITTEQQARADGDSALSALITSLTAEMGDNNAAIQQESQARADGDSALAGQITTLTATVGDNTAAISTEQQARASGDSALAALITSLTAEVGDNSAAITVEQQARVDGDEALAGQITTLSAEVGDNAAAITTEQQARADGDSALAGQITTVSATANSRNRTYRQSTAPTSPVTGDIWFNTSDANRPRRWSGSAWVLTDDTRIAGNAAAITTEQQARADGDSALAAQIVTIEAAVDDNSAAITTEQQARADGDSALSSQINTVSATANSRNRTFRQSTAPSSPVIGDIWYDTSDGRRPKRWSGSAWILTDDTRIAQNTAAITTESVARADADEALAGQITTLTATVSGNTASISSLAATRVTAEGAIAAVEQEISAEYGDLSALATATSFAEATVDGIREGFIWRTGAGGAIELVSVEDGTDGPVTTARIRGDYILLDGNVAIEGNFLVEGEHVQLSANTTIDGYLGSQTFTTHAGWRVYPDGSATFRNVTVDGGNIRSGNFSQGVAGWRITGAGNVEINSGTIRATLQSTNFSSGSAGWRILQNGDAEFNEITLRQGIIGREELAPEATTDIISDFTLGESNPTGIWDTLHQISLGANPIRDIWVVHAGCNIREQSVANGFHSGQFRVQRRVMRWGESFGPWMTVSTEYVAGQGWSDWGFVNFSDIFGGRWQDIQYRAQASILSTRDDPQVAIGPRTINLHMDSVITAERRAR